MLCAVVPTIAVLPERIASWTAFPGHLFSHMKGLPMNNTSMAASLVAALTVAAPALAQNASSQNTSKASQATQSGTSSQNLAAAQQIQQDLQKAGFTDVKVVAESFVVQAKSKDGNPVVMTIGPQGMSVFEAMNVDSKGSQSGSSQGTTGSSSSHPANSK